VGFCDYPLADKLCAVGDAVDFASDPGKAIGDWMAKSAGELAAAAANLAAEAVDTTTKVDLNASWFVDNYEMLLPLGLVLLVATFCAQLVRAAVRRDGQALRQAFTGTASGVLFAFCAIALTTVAVEVVDAVSDGLFKTAHLNIESAVRRIVKVSQIGSLAGLGWLVPVADGLGAAIGAFLYWCVMMVRKVGILVMVTLAVFASAGGGWEVARRWRKGWIEATATLVVSKLLMTVIFVLGIAAMGRTEAKDGIAALADVMSGIVIMILVLLCPYAVFKFVHWAADGTDGESIHRAGGAGAQIAKAHAEKAAPQGRSSRGHRRARWRCRRSRRRTAGPRRRWRRRHCRQPDRRRRRGQGRFAGRRNGRLARRRCRQVRSGEGRPARADERVRQHQRPDGRQPGAGRIRRERRVRPGRRMAVRPADHDPAAAGRTTVLRFTERRVQRGERTAAASDRPLIPCPDYRGRGVHATSRPGFHPRLQDPPLD
jgi:hypothetical protein